MPLLSFEVYSNYEEVIRLRSEITLLENRLKSFGPGTAEATIRNLESQLRAARAQFNALAEDAVRAGAEIEHSIRTSVAKACKQPEVNVKMRADNSDFRKKNAEVLRDMDDTLNKLSEYGESLNGIFKSVSSLAGFTIPLMGVMTFLEHVKSVRSEFQDMESSMQVFLGSEEKGSQFMSQLQDYAWYNMFDFKDLVAASQQMIAYGNSVESIIPAIDKLSNIATATHAPLGEMVALFNKAKATGFVDGQAIQSWALKGLVIKDVLKEMGEKAQGSKITFEQLNKVLTHVTSEGGMFHGIMDSQMNNISASIGQLQDNTDLMFNEIGESMQEPLRKIIDVAAYLVDHFKEVGTVLAAAGVSYGAFKAGSVLNEKATQAAMQETLDKIAEIKKSSSELKLDDDILRALDAKLISKEDAEAWQGNRNELAELTALEEEEKRRKAVADAMDDELSKLRELNKEKDKEPHAEESAGLKLDGDLQKIADSGDADRESIEALQEQRNLLQEKYGIAEKNLNNAIEERTQAISNRDALAEQVAIAQRKKEEADALVEKLQEEHDLLSEDDTMNAPLDELGQVTESYETLKKAEELEEAQKEATARASELAAAQMALESAEEKVNSVETAVNTAESEANAAAINLQTAATTRSTTSEVANTAATNTNTASTTANTVASTKNTIATKLGAIWDRTAAGAKLMFSNAVKSVTASIQAMKVAIMTNPIGMLVTAITTVIGLLAAFKSGTEEVSQEVERFGESAVKSKRNVETLFAVLNSVSKDSKVYKDALRELAKVYKDYGMQVDVESASLDELNQKREKLIKLIMEEGRQRQIANQIEAFQKKQEETTDDFITKMSNSIKDETDNEDVESHAEEFARIMAATIEAKRGEITALVSQLDKTEEEFKNLVEDTNGDGNISAEEGRTYEAERERLRQKIAELQDQVAKTANSEAKELAKKLGLSDDYILDIKDSCGYVKDYLHESAVNSQYLETYTSIAAENQKEMSELKVEPPFDPESFLELDDLFKEYDKRVEEINNTPVEPQVDTTQVDAITESATEAKDSVENLDASSAAPTTDTGMIDDVTVSADNATSAMGVLGKVSATPFINSKWINNASTKINELWIGLQKIMGVDNPEPLIKSENTTPANSSSPAQQKEDLDKAFHDDITRRINAAKTTEDFESLRKSLQARQKKTDQSSSEYAWLEKQIKALDKRDKSKKTGKSDPKQRAYEIRKAQLEEERRTAELLQAERNRQRELEIAQMDDDSEIEIAKIKLNAEKKRQTLEKELKKEAETLERYDLQQWLKGGANRKEYQYYAQFSEAQLAEMRKMYQEQAKSNVGYDTQLSLVANNETADLQKVYQTDISSMRDYLKEYGTFQQQKLAIAEEYAEKIRNAQNKGEELTLTAQRDDELRSLEAKAITSQIDWYSVFDNVGVIMKGQLEPLYKQLQGYVKTDAFRKSGADNQQTVINAMENIRSQIGANGTWKDLASALSDYQSALNELRVATERDAAVSAELARLTEASDTASQSLTDALANPDVTPEQLKTFTDAVEAAQTQLNDYATTVAENNQAMQEAQNRVQSSGTMLSMTAKNVTQPVSKIYKFLSGAGFSQLAELWGAFDSLKGGINGLKTLRDAAKKSKELADSAKEAAGAVDGMGEAANKVAETSVKIAESADKVAEGADKVAEGAGEMGNVSGDMADGAKQSGKILGKEVSKDLIDGLESAGLIAQVISSVLSILDILKDGVGTLISSVLDTIFNAISGILDNILSGEMFKQIGESIYSGVTGLFKSIFTMGGAFDWIGNGDSDKNLERDIERLTATNEALRRAVDNLAEEMRDAATADMGDMYKKQKDDLQQSMKNTQEMMQRSGAAYSNGTLGIGGTKSSNYKIDKGMDSSDWARISQLVGTSVNSASDFWNLSSEQMAAVAKSAPDLYAKIKDLADNGYKDAGQFMDEYIEYYKELEELEAAFRESLTDVSFDSVKDEFKSLLLDMESDSKDFANNWEKMMQQAVINSLMNSKYTEKLNEWYKAFSDAMNDNDGLTEDEQSKLKQNWDDIVNEALVERDELKRAMGWDSSAYSQEASKAGVTTITEDTGLAIIGRMTAMQEAVEAIRASESSSVISLADLTDELIQIGMEYSRFNVHQDNIERQLAKIYIELQVISENTGAIVKPILSMQTDIAEIKKNTKNL